MINVLLTRVSFYRNVKDYKFVPKLTDDKAHEIEDKVAAALAGIMDKKNLDSLTEEEMKNLKSLGLVGRANQLYLTKNCEFSVNLFEDEHIKITACKTGFDCSVYEQAKQIETTLKDKISMSYLDEYGYLMSNLNYLGNGVSFEAVVNLSSIAKQGKIEQIKQNVRKLGFNLTDFGENLYILSTKCNLGYTETEIKTEFEKMLSKLVDVEIESSKILELNAHDEIENEIMRSQAILNSATLLPIGELSIICSNLLLGVNLGMIKVDEKILQKLYSIILQNHSNNNKFTPKEIASKVKEILKGGKNG